MVQPSEDLILIFQLLLEKELLMLDTDCSKQVPKNIFEGCQMYLHNMQYNDLDPNEDNMGIEDPIGRLGGVSPLQVVAVLVEFAIHNIE